MIAVLLYTDSPLLAQGLTGTVANDPDCEPLRVSYTLQELDSALAEREPDILLLDLTQDVTFAVMGNLKRVAPDAKVLLWVNSIASELAYQAMSLGVRGILRKNLGEDLIRKCLHKVYEGELWFEKALTDSFLIAKRIPLTRREGQLIALLSQGMKNKEIASALLITEGTVKVYLSKLFRKVGVQDRFELALYGLKNITASRMDAGSLTSPDIARGLRSIVIDKTFNTSRSA